MNFIINGKGYSLTREQVERTLEGITPDTSRGGLRHFVEVNGKMYPVTHALEACIGLSRADFTSHRARGIFRRLAFPVHERRT